MLLLSGVLAIGEVPLIRNKCVYCGSVLPGKTREWWRPIRAHKESTSYRERRDGTSQF